MWNTFRTINFQDFDKALEDFGKSFDSSFGTAFGNFPSEDFTDTGDGLLAKLDVPCVVKEDVEVDYSNRILSVTAKRSEDKTYSGKWRITQGIDSEKISAKLENGVLIITMPKKDSEKGKKIAVD